MFNWADYAVIVIILVSMGFSFIRGFIRESLSVVVWLLAFWLALTFAASLSLLFTNIILHPMLRFAASFLILLVATLIIGGLVSHLLSHFVRSTGLSGTDRSLGLLFGFIRGMIIVLLILFVSQMIYSVTPGWWHHSVLISKIWLLMQPLQHMLPISMQQHIKISV